MTENPSEESKEYARAVADAARSLLKFLELDGDPDPEAVKWNERVLCVLIDLACDSGEEVPYSSHLTASAASVIRHLMSWLTTDDLTTDDQGSGMAFDSVLAATAEMVGVNPAKFKTM